MKLYADLPGTRARQLLADVAVLALMAGFVWLGVKAHQVVLRLREPGAALERAGAELTDAGGRGAGAVGDLPVVGDVLAQPFEWLGDSGRTFAEAGARSQETVGDVALVIGLLIALPPLVLLPLAYLPGRARWVREATAAGRLPPDELLALRALATRPLRELLGVSPDPVGDYRAGRWEALADLERRELGLRR